MNYILNKIKLYKKILENLTYLAVLQVFNLFLPLISYPYLLSTIGTEKYGLIIYSSVIISYFIILINFGFNISATKNISIYRNDKNKISEIVSSTLLIKGLILLLSFFILMPLLIFITDFNDYFLLYIITYIACLYEAFFPFWYFQGIEEMKYITYINVITRGVFTILIFILVNSPEDYIIVPTLNAFGYLIACLISLYIVFIKNKVNFFLPKKNVLKFYFKESAPFFISRASAVVINRTNTVLIGVFYGYSEVSYYDLAYKLVELCKIPSNIINQTIYPKVALSKNMNFVVKVIKYNLVLSFIICVTLYFWIDNLILYFLKEEMLNAKNIIYVLSLTVVLSGISYFFGNTMLVVNDRVREFNMSVIYQGLLFILLILPGFILNYDILLYASIVVVTSFFEVIYRYYYIKKYNII